MSARDDLEMYLDAMNADVDLRRLIDAAIEEEADRAYENGMDSGYAIWGLV